MNYITEINRFYDWLIQNPISSNSQALWHRLMAYCNSFGWEKEFTLTNTRLIEELAIPKSSFERARNSLIQKGRIKYKIGKGNQCGIYSIVSFALQNDPNSGAQTEHNALCKPSTMRGSVDVQSETLNKQNKTKPIKNISNDISKKTDLFAEYAGEDQALLSALHDFENMRKSIKSPMNDRMKQLLLSELEKIGQDKVALLQQAVLNGWKSVYPLKTQGGQGNQKEQKSPKNSSFDLEEFERMSILNVPKN